MPWDDSKIAVMKLLWAEGKSASYIADRIGGDLTRNAVLGKLHRMGLAGTSPDAKRRQASGGRKSAAQQRKAGAGKWGHTQGETIRKAPWFPTHPIPDGEEIIVPLAERKSILDLEQNDCRWPIGDPQHADFHFCNSKKAHGLPYCEHHAARAYQPPQPRRYNNQGEVRAAKEREKVDA